MTSNSINTFNQIILDVTIITKVDIDGYIEHNTI